MKVNRVLLLVLTIINLSKADGFSIGNLLQDIEKKTDLSQKTKLANSGVSFIYTRDDIQRMQIKNLKDILKSIYPFGYNENRYGLPDPFSSGTNQPFMSSQMRIFIDNQEISTGLYGSGLFMLGDLNIGWVDHIEIYTQNPTYEFATESTMTLIKLYTKSASRDEGGKVELNGGSYGASNISGYYTEELEDWSYFAFASYNDDKRKKYYSTDKQVSRDKDTKTIIATLNKDNHNILLTAITQKRDGFLDLSLDASPESSTVDANYIHIGYDAKIDNFSYLFSYAYLKVKALMIDDVTPISTAPYYDMFPISLNESDTKSAVFTGELKYNLDTNKNKLIAGLKYRMKKYKFNQASVNGISLPILDNDTQTITTIFLENQYFIKQNSIITSGLQYSKVTNNSSPQDDDLFMYRLGYTFTNKEFTIKTICSHTEITLEPYLINSYFFMANPTVYHKPQEVNTILENIIYTKDNNKYELVLDYTQGNNHLLVNSQGKLETYDKYVVMKGVNTRWTHNYNRYDKLFIDIGYRKISNFQGKEKDLELYTATIRTLNTYNKFDIFNELLYNRDNISNKNFYDYSAGVKYNYSEDLIISLKGTNLLDSAKTTDYYRVDATTFAILPPLEISPIDKSIILSMEYTF